MKKRFRRFAAVALPLLTIASSLPAAEKTLRVGVVQTAVENSLEFNRDRIIRFIGQARHEGCQLVVFSENELYWDGSGYDSPDAQKPDGHPTKREMDAAIDRIREAIREARLTVVFGADSRRTEGGPFSGRAYAFGPDGRPLVAYWKNSEVPPPFDVAGVRCNLTICSDRGYLEHSDLACLVDGAQIIIDTSGATAATTGVPTSG